MFKVGDKIHLRDAPELLGIIKEIRYKENISKKEYLILWVEINIERIYPEWMVNSILVLSEDKTKSSNNKIKGLFNL